MLSELLAEVPVRARRGRLDVDVVRLTADSREAGAGALFVAIPGARFDGHSFLPSVLESEVAAVIVRDWPAEWPEHVCGVQVSDPRRALSLAAAALHGHPSRRLRVVGVTGTNGKTSTATIARALLRAAGLRTGFIGTTGVVWDGPLGERSVVATHTTPDGPALQALLAEMVRDGVEAVAIELSSHALEQGRAAGLDLDVGAWTNLSRDHLDYHGTMERYAAAKALLFDEVLPASRKARPRAVLCVDDPGVVALLGPRGASALRVSTSPGAVARGEADLAPLQAPTFSLAGIDALICTPEGDLLLRSCLLGAHNLQNLLVAGACALALGVPPDAVVAGWGVAPAAPGRMERVEAPHGPLVVVDYAHTPDALRAVLASLRPFVPSPGRLVTVFGCGGDRDAGKRPLMTTQAVAGSDAVVLTSDNPRSEDPELILDAMAADLPASAVVAPSFLDPITTPVARVTDRRDAIRAAIAGCRPGDLILLAGKGHEMSQEIRGRKLPFDDRAEARRALAEFHPPANEPPPGFSEKGRVVRRFPEGDGPAR